ncbi:MAG: MBL fold metallo-hydrolase [Verrucomicrobiia bacterium]|jgi:glyoxylase-like metal-dependent hydrolase (beta-lactamase superfamily II)
MIIETFEAGPVATNGYLVADKRNGSALVIDAPQGVSPLIVEQARKWNTAITYLVSTHGHWDHILDNAELLRLTGAKFGIHRESAPLLNLPQARYFGLDLDIEPNHPDFFLKEGKPLDVGELRFEIFHCPGHCPGSVVLFERKERAAFVGDVLFAGSVGRADLPGGDYETLLRSIREKLLPLGDDVRVFPGHGPVTTIGHERLTNPFLAADGESNP